MHHTTHERRQRARQRTLLRTRPHTGPRAGQRAGSGSRTRLISLALALPLAVPILVPVAAPAARAASLDGMISLGNYEIGAFVLADGSLAYCLEPGAQAPLSAQLAATRVSELPGYSASVNDAWGWSGEVRTSPASGEKLRQINWLLSEHGNSGDPDRAVAVQIAIWEIRREAGNAGWMDGKYDLFTRNGGASYVAAGKQLAIEAKTAALGPGHAVPDSALALKVDEDPGDSAGTARGSGTVSYPRGTTALSIAGGRFAGGEATLRITDGRAGTVAWEATPHEPDWRRSNEVAISGTWALTEKFWPAEIIMHPSTRSVEQRLGVGVRPLTGQNTGKLEPVRVRFDSRFAPAISTQVPEDIVQRAEGVFRDRVTVSSPDTAWPSRRGGEEYLPLLADGALYGPFLTPQEERPEPPDGAPIAARTTLDITDGPGDYLVELAPEALAAGYYYWLWEIREERQPDEIRRSEVLEAGGRYADSFGVRAERQLVPTELRWETRLEQREVTPESRTLEDRVRATLVGGGWLRDETGERIPANVRLTFYQVDERPRRQPTPPPAARELGAVTVTLSEPDAWIAAPPFAVPASERGWVTVRACLFAEDQDADAVGTIAEWCDDFGVPDETAKIVEQATETAREVPEALAESGRAAPEERLLATPMLALAAGLLSLGGAFVGTGALRRRALRGRDSG